MLTSAPTATVGLNQDIKDRMCVMSRVTPIDFARPPALEFFAGIGLARLGLEAAGFRVAWANDFSEDKLSMYAAQFNGATEYLLQDIATVSANQLPTNAAVAWASSPCTDLSLAGTRAGLGGTQSGTFWHFIRILQELETHRPSIIVLENVTGLATSHGGDDIAAAIRAFNELDYSVDVLMIDARRFIPQSRPRLFLIGALTPPESSVETSPLRPDSIQWIFDDPTLKTHRALLPPVPELLSEGLSKLIEQLPPDDHRWWPEERLERFIGSLSQIQLQRLRRFQDDSTVRHRTAYRRTRNGKAVWEIRPDDISGCLRTARGGSSKQAVVEAGRGNIRVRWMTPKEYANLMGAEDYTLSTIRTNQALFGFGDAVAVPVVRWLAKHYLMPLARNSPAIYTNRPEVAHVQ